MPAALVILDTNVFSEVVKPRPEPRVMSWLSAQPFNDVFLTAITAAESLHGLARMPQGKRKLELQTAVNGLLRHEFGGRILPFDEAAASQYATLVSERERIGRAMEAFDAQIAAIARVHSAVLATRNVRHFDGCGVTIIDPWGG